MKFTLNDEQQLLQDSVARFVAERYEFATRQRRLEAASVDVDANWATFAENGWLAAALPESNGGLGGSVVDTCVITQQFGRGLVIEPYLGCAVLAAQTFAAAASPEQARQWLPPICDGSRRLALAHSEQASRGLERNVATRAVRGQCGYTLRGAKSLVAGGVGADAFVVSARTAGGVGDEHGTTLFLVSSDTEGLSTHPVRLHDGTTAVELVLEDVRPDAVLGEVDAAATPLRHGWMHAVLALCADQVGVMERAIEVTAEYLRQRKQFDAPLARFQALQHRMADMAAEMELARSMLFAAAAAHTNDEPDRDETLAMAKAFVTRASRNVCAQAIQLHGGIGMSDEYVVGHYFKRAVVADVLFGVGTLHERTVAIRLQSRLAASSGSSP